MTLWIVLGTIIIYLIVGLLFEQPDDWKWYMKIPALIFWFPLVLLVFTLLTIDKHERKKIKRKRMQKSKQ
jgi:MFS family permease